MVFSHSATVCHRDSLCRFKQTVLEKSYPECRFLM